MNAVASSHWRGVVALALACASCAFGQGSLTPPGPPGPIMKSLDQLEPRTPISSLPYTIDRSGSYYLTRNLVATGGDGITVNVSSVTIDLNGFTIISSASPAAGAAIVLKGANITILNGHIAGGITFVNNSFGTGAGFLDGIIDPNSIARNVLVRDVTVDGCNNGISVAAGTIEHCSVRSIAESGISATSISDSVAENCGSTGLSAATVQNSRAVAVLGGSAIIAGSVLNCSGVSVNGAAITGNEVMNSTGYSSGSGSGIDAQLASNCYGTSTSGIGLEAVGSATNCRGYTASGAYGITATLASFCYGSTNAATIGLTATTAIGCVGAAPNGGTPVSATNKYLMP